MPAAMSCPPVAQPAWEDQVLRYVLVAVVGMAVLGIALALTLWGLPQERRAPEPTPPALSQVPAVAPPATVPASPVPALFEFRADSGKPRSYDAGCDVGLFLRNRTNRLASISGIVDGFIGQSTTGTTAPFLIQYVGPGEEKSTTVNLKGDCAPPGQERGVLGIRAIYICKLDSQYFENCLANAAGPAAVEAGRFDVIVDRP